MRPGPRGIVETAPQEGNMVLFLGIVSQLFVLPPRSEWTIANLYNIITMAIIMLSANHIYTVAHDWWHQRQGATCGGSNRPTIQSWSNL